MPNKAQLIAELERIKAENEALRQDKAYGGLTRPALEIEHRKRVDECQYVVFTDLNGIHKLNEQLGMETVDTMIRSAFSFHLREKELILFGRWKSGDEEAFLIKGDPEGFIQRLHQTLLENGLTTMSAFAKIEAGNLLDAVEEAYQKVKKAKSERNLNQQADR